MRFRVAATLALSLLALAPSAAAQTGKPQAPAAPKPVAPKPPTSPASAKGAPKGTHASPAAPKNAPAAKGAKKGGAKKPGEPGEPDENARRVIAGTAAPPGHTIKESAELRAMRELDASLFPSAAPPPAPVWTAEGLVLDGPRVSASGLPPSPLLQPAATLDAPADLSWLKKLDLPDIPVRWDARVVKYLDFYKNNARGRSMVAGWIKKSGRYGGAIRRVLRENNLPEDILWLSLVESGFDPTISSPVGAAGLWQFMPEGGRIYGLTVDRWVDERLDPERSTAAAAKYLADLKQRFGTWELAFAAYDMGYGGLLAAIRKYNTNDYWELSRLESGMPLETALYVPKIVAIAVVARNKAVFGCADVELDPAVTFDKVAVAPGVTTRAIAVAAGATETSIAELNPQLLASRTPPSLPSKVDAWTVRVPAGHGQRAAKVAPSEADQKLERIVVRWGETLDDLARRRGVKRSELAALNGMRSNEMLRPGTVLLAPRGAGVGEAVAASTSDAPHEKPVVVVPAAAASLAYADKRRYFYRVIAGDTARDVAKALGVPGDDLARWNALDPAAALHEAMILQVFLPKDRDVSQNALVIEDKDARVLVAGSPDFYAYFEGQRGRSRIELLAKDGDTWKGLAHKYGLSVAQLERINQKSRSSAIAPGDKLVVYVPTSKADAARAKSAPDTKDADVALAGGAADPYDVAPANDATAPAIEKPERDEPAARDEKKTPPSL